MRCLFLLFIFSSCSLFKKDEPSVDNSQKNKAPIVDSQRDRKVDLIQGETLDLGIRYDTIEADFLYEAKIGSYLQGDAISKSGEFIFSDNVSEAQYLKGYFLVEDYYLHMIKLRNKINIRYDSVSVSHLDSLLVFKYMNNYDPDSSINPYCGLYYDKYHLKIEVVYLGTFLQQIPIFFNCDDLSKYLQNNAGKTYQNLSLPTYIITNVFKCEPR